MDPKRSGFHRDEERAHRERLRPIHIWAPETASPEAEARARIEQAKADQAFLDAITDSGEEG